MADPDSSRLRPAGASPSRMSAHLRLWPFGLWLAGFYVTWTLIVVVGDQWATVTAHWPIALAMALGSYFAGSTPMGGGSVGFPVLVLLFDMPASLGRNFGLAVQSIGMVSASIYIFAARRPVAWTLLRPALVGAVIGTPIGALAVAPFAPELVVKLLFAVTWASFGVIHLWKLRPLVASRRTVGDRSGMDRYMGLCVGLSGGVAASLTGVGIDMMIYAVLALMYRADLKIAIPTSVVLMAFTSVVGIASNVALASMASGRYAIDSAVYANWLAAAPVVAIGAPFGAMVVSRLPRAPTLLIISVLCLGQFIWTLVREQVTGGTLAVSLGGLAVTVCLFHAMFRWGENGQPTDATHAALTAESEPALQTVVEANEIESAFEQG